MKKLNLCAKTYVLAVSVTAALAVSSCATVNSPVNVEEQNISKNEQIASQQQATAAHEPVLKRKIAIGRFTNESQYGRLSHGQHQKQEQEALANLLKILRRF